MLVPFLIFLMILSPVLIPAAVTAADAASRAHRRNRMAGHPRSVASGRFAVAAAA
jgi:hypothetical protein